MVRCPKCGKEVSENDNYCMNCGAELRKPQPEAPRLPPETYGFDTPQLSEAREVLVRRFEGLRLKDADAILRCIDSERYTKFDDWPPYRRQRRDALKNEADALAVLSNYQYHIQDLAIDIVDGVGVATFHLSYRGQIRKRPFEIRSRVTAILHKVGDEWKITHEHYSRFPAQ